MRPAALIAPSPSLTVVARAGKNGGCSRVVVARERNKAAMIFGISSSSSAYSYDSKFGRERKRTRTTTTTTTTRAEREGNNSPYHTQNEEKLLDLLTVQSVKTVLHYLQETNGEMHMFLHNYLHDNPMGQTYRNSAGQPRRESGEEWLVKLASSGLTTVTDPMRGSVPTLEDSQPKTREISPRDCVERILATRKDLSEDFVSFLEKVEMKNGSVLRNALERTFSTMEEEGEE
jgi:hypothetical protein